MNAPLLRLLVESRGVYLPAATLGGPAERVWADLDEIEAFGFEVERHPVLGVCLRRGAERLCPDQIEHGLGTECVGRRVAVWNRVSSTNDLAAAAAKSSANEGLVVLAEEQSAGRGSRGRSWVAPPKTSLLLSVLLFPPESLADPAWLTALAAVAVAEVASSHSPEPARIKWPNDVRVGGRKLAGILTERGAGSVVGIGLNVNTTAADLPPELREMATSLRRLSGAVIDRSELARDLIRRLDALYQESRRLGPGCLNERWRARSEHLGRRVRIETASGVVTGRLDDLDLQDGLSVTGRHAASRIPLRDVRAILDDPGRAPDCGSVDGSA